MLSIYYMTPMVSKVIELSTGEEVVVDYEMYELLRTNNLIFNTMYKGIPFDPTRLKLEDISTNTQLNSILKHYPKDQVDRFYNYINRNKTKGYSTSYGEVDLAFIGSFVEGEYFVSQWYTDCGDSSYDYDPITITTIKYLHEAEFFYNYFLHQTLWYRNDHLKIVGFPFPAK